MVLINIQPSIGLQGVPGVQGDPGGPQGVQGIQGIQGWPGPQTGAFVYRGPLNLPDYDQDSLLLDNQYHDLDLSNIVSISAKCALIDVAVAGEVGKTVNFRRNGLTGLEDNIGITVQVKNVVLQGQIIVGVDDNRIIECAISNKIVRISLVVRGWWN